MIGSLEKLVLPDIESVKYPARHRLGVILRLRLLLPLLRKEGQRWDGWCQFERATSFMYLTRNPEAPPQ